MKIIEFQSSVRNDIFYNSSQSVTHFFQIFQYQYFKLSDLEMKHVLVPQLDPKMEHVILRKYIHRTKFIITKSYFTFYRVECASKGGTSSGSCASGFGVCCICKF